MVANLVITMPVAFVPQRTRSTWPRIVLRHLIKVGFPIIGLSRVSA